MKKKILQILYASHETIEGLQDKLGGAGGVEEEIYTALDDLLERSLIATDWRGMYYMYYITKRGRDVLK